MKFNTILGENFVDPGVHTDAVGHGTAVAGIAMSMPYGVAKKATSIALGVNDPLNHRPVKE